MKFTQFFYCEDKYKSEKLKKNTCDFDQAIVEGLGNEIIQCSACFEIDSKIPKKKYFLECNHCHYKNERLEDMALDEEIECLNCYLKGNVAFDAFQDGLFVLKEEEYYEPCKKCKRDEWTKRDEGFKCPRCWKNLKQKMSTFWIDEETD